MKAEVSWADQFPQHTDALLIVPFPHCALLCKQRQHISWAKHLFQRHAVLTGTACELLCAASLLLYQQLGMRTLKRNCSTAFAVHSNSE